MSHTDMDMAERQQDAEQAGQADMLQALRSASLPDDFWMYSYKILPCPHGYRHSWTHCPFSHVGETARRRCPRTHNYLPDPCVNARAKRQCPNGDACPYAHNTFEQWLHPARYRTRLCYLGANCRRPTCFFAHSVEELRSVEENESAGAAIPQTAAMPPPLPPLPVPPPLPSPASTIVMPPSGSSGDFGSLSPAMPPTSGGAAAVSAVPAGAPMGLLQPVVLMGIPQLHQALRPDLMQAHGAVQCYMPYQARPAMMRPPMPMAAPPLQGDSAASQQMQMHLQMHPSGAVAVRPQGPAVRPQHLANPTVTVAAVHHHPGSFVYLPSNVPPPIAQGPPPPPPPPPPQGFASPFITPGGYHRSGEGVPPSVTAAPAGRMRSWSNPGETAYFVSAAPALSSGGSRTYGGGEQPPMWASVDGRRAAGLPSAVTAMATSPRGATPLAHGGGGRGGGNAAAAPRHMPAPTNRGGAVRRMSTPAGALHASAPAAAAAAAAAAVTFMHYSEQQSGGSAGSSPGLRTTGSMPDPRQKQQQMHQSSATDGVEAALRALAMTTKPVAAPPPTPVVSHIAAGGSPYSPSHSSSSSPQSISVAGNGPSGSPSVAMAMGAAHADLAILRGRPSADGAFSRPSSSGSGASVCPIITTYDSSTAAAAAAALAAVSAAGVEIPTNAVSAPYQTLLQHVLRSASASAAEPTSGLLPALLNGGGNGVHAVHADLYYDGDVDVMERSSDPGPVGLHAAIRRISTEFGSAGGACRNSDPGHGQSVPPTGTDVQQLLLPLLQSVLTEGLATGQFELVNGQLQLKNGGGAAAAVGATTFAAVADATSVGRPVEPTPPCVPSPGINA